MKGFIEVTVDDAKRLINVDHIVMVRKGKRDNETTIRFSYYGGNDISSITVDNSYNEVISLIEVALK
jgi:hypothetical protein